MAVETEGSQPKFLRVAAKYRACQLQLLEAELWVGLHFYIARLMLLFSLPMTGCYKGWFCRGAARWLAAASIRA
jgi:hypothetical protein